MHVYLYTSTINSLHIVYFQRSMTASEKESENHVKINENSGTINEKKWKLNENHTQIEEKHRQIEENHWKMEENHGNIYENHGQINENHGKLDKKYGTKSWNHWKNWWTLQMRDFSYKMQQMRDFSGKSQGREPGRKKTLPTEFRTLKIFNPLNPFRTGSQVARSSRGSDIGLAEATSRPLCISRDFSDGLKVHHKLHYNGIILGLQCD